MPVKPNAKLQVDATQLPEGLHYAEVRAEDSSAPWRGPLFRVPVTVIKTTPVETLEAAVPPGLGNGDESTHADDYIARLGTITFQPGTEERRFVSIPEGATWATVKVRAGAHSAPR